MDDGLEEFFQNSDDASSNNLTPDFTTDIKHESNGIDGSSALQFSSDGDQPGMPSAARRSSWSNEQNYQSNSDDACNSEEMDDGPSGADAFNENHKNDNKLARFVCDFVGCGRTYCSLGNLRMHQRTHRGELKYQCTHSECGKCFLTSYRLKVHVRAHTKEKPYKCETCEKSFNTLYR